jgi:hypothetical protein
MDANDGKWADRKRLAIIGANSKQRRESKEPRRATNGGGPSPIPALKKEIQLTALSEFVGSTDDGVETPLLANLRGEAPLQAQAKKYAQHLPDIRGGGTKGVRGGGGDTTTLAALSSNDETYANILPHKGEPATTTGKGMGGVGKRQSRRHDQQQSGRESPGGRDDVHHVLSRPGGGGGGAATPPATTTSTLARPTHDGGAVSQPQSRLVLESEKGESEGEDSEAAYMSGADPDTDINNAPVLPTGRRKVRIRVVVRKRPVRDGETGEDCVEVTPPAVRIGAIKQRVDLSEYTENFDYDFDEAFAEQHNNEHVYSSCGRALLDTVFEGGSASCFAYGQTGSGKTHTMIGSDTENGMYMLAAQDLFARLMPDRHRVFVSLYEIYCNSLFDLLNYRSVVVAREDATKRVNICGLTWHEISDPEDLRRLIDKGTIQRRTGSTSANEFSSRSHAVMTITLRDESNPKFCGSLNIVDLAGSERAADTAAHDKQTRLEGAEINKSLLALKECIRGLDERKKHIPFRGSKLTEVLRDSFVGNSSTVMVATVSPTSDSVEHTLNTLRYAFRVKGLTIAQVEPSKERNAPRVFPPAYNNNNFNLVNGGGRSRSIEPVAVGNNNNYPPLLLPVAEGKEKKKRRSREKRSHHRRAPRGGDDDPTAPGDDDSTTGGHRHLRASPRIRGGSDVSMMAPPAVGRKEIEQLEVGLKNEIQMLREEFQSASEQKDRHIHTLEMRNQRLEKQLERMMRMMGNAQVVEMEDV